jgi:shikimate kinase
LELGLEALDGDIRLVNSTKSIVLIGFMGAGKSSIGRWLERRTGLWRLDTDEMVAAKYGLSIPEIFSNHGETAFRDAETETLRELSPDRPAIIVTGGGTILRSENVALLKRLGTMVWLHGDEKTLFERAGRRGRPLLQTENPRQTFSELMKKRKPLYAEAADFRVDTTVLSHEQVADAILCKIEELAQHPR